MERSERTNASAAINLVDMPVYNDRPGREWKIGVLEGVEARDSETTVFEEDAFESPTRVPVVVSPRSWLEKMSTDLTPRLVSAQCRKDLESEVRKHVHRIRRPQPPNVTHQRARATASRGNGTNSLRALRCMR